MDIKKVQEEIVEEFSVFDDWMDRYNLLIDIGKTLPEIDPKYKTNEFLIEGCQSKVWLYPEYDGEKITFTADSDAIITKGIIGLLIRVLSDRKPDEILEADLGFIDEIGLRQNLSPTRSNGLLSMIKRMKTFALVYKNKKD